MGLLSRIRTLLTRAPTGGWTTGVSWPSVSSPWNWWQINATARTSDFRYFGPVFACWEIIAQEVSRVPLQHILTKADGSTALVTTKAPARVFRRPNRFQTISDLLLFVTQSLLAEGNAYAFARRNARFEVTELYPIHPRKCSPHISDDGEIYYQVADSDTLRIAQSDEMAGFWFPARDLWHTRLFTLDSPLVGVSPLVAATAGVNAGMSINNNVAAFFGNASRPSGIITHPKRLEKEQVKRIKERFVEATSGDNTGAPVVLSEDMKWAPLTMSAVDAELVASYRLTERQVAQIYRVPPFLLGDLEDAKFASVESLMRMFVNSGLGFYLSHIAQSLTQFFDLALDETIEFDYETALLRADLESRMKALKEGVQGGIMSPNEARRRERLQPVEFGDAVRVQQQMVPLSFGANLQPTPAPAPAPAAPPEPEPESEPEESEEPEGIPELDDEEARSATVLYMTQRILGKAA